MAAKKATTKKAPAEKKPSLDIKDEMLYSDYKVFDWLEQQPEDLAKTFSPLVAMKWQSVVQNCSPEVAAYYITATNTVVNRYFWELSKHPELQWRLMCSVGLAEEHRHGWVPMANKRKSVSKLDQVFLKLHPQFNDEELVLFRSKFTVDSLKELLRDMALSDAEIKPLVDEFKKTNG